MAGSGYHEQLQWHLAPAMVAAVGNEVLPLEEEGGARLSKVINRQGHVPQIVVIESSCADYLPLVEYL